MKIIKKTCYKIKYIKMIPSKAINMSYKDSLKYLKNLIGKVNLQKAFDINNKYPSPVLEKKDSNWLKKSKIIGINPRITKTYWGIVKYALTFPENAIHIMPLLMPGVDSGIYSPLNWQLSSEFLDKELVSIGYDTAEKQLKLVVNVLHSLGKTVGFDSLLHCDRFAEHVFVNPMFFEWIRLNKERTAQLVDVDYNKLYLEVENLIKDYLKRNGSADNTTTITDEYIDLFFTSQITEKEKFNILFGRDIENKRRKELIALVRNNGFETVPVTEHSPCRPVVFDKLITEGENEWAKFKVENKSKEAKIFGSLTPFKLYPIDKEGYPETDSPNYVIWDYLAQKYDDFQNKYNFDFLRADMAHNQQSQSHKSAVKKHNNDLEIWAYIKHKIQTNKPHFASLAEAFLNMNYYIDGYQDMENKQFDAVLGPVNFMYLDNEYILNMKKLIQLDNKYNFKTCIVSITNDTDRKENNDLHKSPLANEIRVFTSLFTDSPGYMGIGLETRDYEPENKYCYANHYTNYQPIEYKWGNNLELFNNINKIRELFTEIYPQISKEEMFWLNTNNEYTVSWFFINKETNEPSYLFAINLDTSSNHCDIQLQNIHQLVKIQANYHLTSILSTANNIRNVNKIVIQKEHKTLLDNFTIGEARAYKIVKSEAKNTFIFKLDFVNRNKLQ